MLKGNVVTFVKFGIDTRICKSIDLSEILKKLNSVNIECIEICCNHIIKYEEKIGLKELAKKINDLLSTCRYKIVQVHGPHEYLDYRLGSLNENDFKDAIKKLISWIEFSNLINCNVLVIHTPRKYITYNESMIEYVQFLKNRLLKTLKEVESFCKNFNVKIAIENRLEHEFGVSPRDIIDVLEQVNSEWFGFCLDTGHANVNKLDIVKIIESYGKYIIASHVHDNNGERDEHKFPMLGIINWKEVLNVWKKYIPNVPIILEVEGGRNCDNQLKTAELIINYLRSLA